MKKTVIIIVLLFALLLSACGKTAAESTAKPAQDAAKSTPVPEKAESAPVEEPAPVEKPEQLSEDDFIITVINDSECEIKECLSKAKEIIVPDTISGHKVIGLGGSVFFTADTEKIVLPDTVEYIGSMAFNSCESLREVQLGSGLKSIGKLAFNFCPKLERIEFPDGMESIKDIVFGGAESLAEVYIPASVTDIPNGITFPQFCPNIVIVTPAGSVAEASALQSGLTVKNP